MNKISLTIAIALLLTVSEKSRGQSLRDDGDVITIDVTKNYPATKDLILQDFMDVEYIALETNDEFVNQGHVMDIGEHFIIVGNFNNDGDIFVYDRSGKAVRKINNKGQQISREYQSIFGITLDEDNNEMFVADRFTRSILVYNLRGKFQRRFKQKGRDEDPIYTEIFNFDNDHLICYDGFNKADRTFVLVSKKDGNITKEFKIPFIKEQIPIQLTKIENEKTVRIGHNKVESTVQSRTATPSFNPIIPVKDNWIIIELSSDTIYSISRDDYNLRPFLTRTPSVHSLDPKVSLLLSGYSDRYYFMETMEFTYDWDASTGFPKTPILYDKQEKDFFRYKVYNGDYTNKKEIQMHWFRHANHDISWIPLNTERLVEAYEKEELKGKLKEIASTLKEDDNRVIMLVKQKK